MAYVNEFIKARTGRSGVVAFHQTLKEFMQHFVDTVSPSEFLVDFYPVKGSVPRPGEEGYGAGLRGALDDYVTWYGRAREVALGAGIPLWGLVQAHSWGQGLRDPSAQEIRVQVHLALAHGVTGIYYFMYSSHTNDDGRPDLQGPGGPILQNHPQMA